MNEISIKLQRVREFLAHRKLTGALFGNQNNFAWLTGGKDAHVVMAGDGAVGSILVTRRGAYLLANNIESVRLFSEEVSSRQFTPLVHPWQEGQLAKKLLLKVAGKGTLASDNGAHGTRNLSAELTPLRWQLTKEEIHRYREVGQIASDSLEKTCRTIKPGNTEFEIAAIGPVNF